MRKKPDWSKPFKFIDNKKAFDDLQAADDTLIVIASEEPRAPPPKQDIIVPAIDTVPRCTLPKSFARITPNYIRLPAELNLPLATHYQLTEVDHIFLQSHQERFLLKGRRVLTADFLRRALVELEMRAGKDMTLPRNKGWMTAFLQREAKEVLEMESVNTFAETVYNYWKNRREELRFPLLRQLWKPNPDEYNHMLAFRPREREKRSLRRTNRYLEDEILQQLADEFDLALRLADRTQHREQLKLRQVQYNLSSFYAQCRSLIPMPDFLPELKAEDRANDKERLKRLHSDLEEYMKEKVATDNQVVQESTSDIDQKQTIVNFLASVVAEAEALGLSYDRLFYSSNALVDKRASVVAPVLPQPVLPVLPVLPPEPSPPNPEEHTDELLQMTLVQHEGLIIRAWEADQEGQQRHVRPSRDLLQYRRRQVGKFYFGSDDQCQQKDLRKTIAASFKKFQQMHSFCRTVSAHSQNN